ncbi:LacI family DNA-binding transcriptional regulator [Ideonella livida]|uniref:LacI family transcriptional regulator n=1 Tax=Ideonella livida TaxID=2707176 RepID=A0A7C9TLV9_9BURK|nr:LacI family DNA-binding transcriptional regulator [Ideonella livida]NDY93799.1 LacI family transcriptional regulator [Ideonella livida]
MKDSASETGGARVSITDVAQAAQVSIKTVSRVLRGEMHVAAATRAAVEKAARELGYLPDLSARNLKSSVPSVVGLLRAVGSDGQAPRSGHEYMMCLQIGAMQACQELDFGLMVLPVQTDPQAALRELTHRYRTRQVGGFVVPSQIGDLGGVLEALDAESIPYAAINPADLQRASRWVVADERQAVRAMIRHLLAKGHQRVALVRSDLSARVSAEREAGYRAALEDAGLPVDPALIFPAEGLTFDHGRRCGHRLLAQADSPTAVFAVNDELAAGVIAAAHERGLELPRELSVVGYDDLDLARKLWPDLTTVHQPIEQLGETAARQVIAALHPLRWVDRQPATQVVLPCEVVLRGSVATPALRHATR